MPDSASDKPRQLSNDEYTVGWICALETEYIAAQLCLDEKHAPPIDVVKPDSNDYTLGRVGRHNVAIAVMPGGKYGTASAATTATDMLHTFSNIRIGLMVGIGGGAPTKANDIRLGDVVVSLPQNGFGGVFQYDFGKTIQGQPFQATRSLSLPPRVLLTAIHGLEAEYARNGHTIQQYIRTCLKTKRKQLRERFSRPRTDLLYVSANIHQAGTTSCLDYCGTDDASIVFREAREDDEDDPTIHYGLIASANQLMKDAVLRDQYASESKVLCFEVEAGGLTNHFPCIVIRGICDYSDSHKNKDWQGYAAMTAAAYARDLLGRISPDRVQTEKKIKDVIDEGAKADSSAAAAFSPRSSHLRGNRGGGSASCFTAAASALPSPQIPQSQTSSFPSQPTPAFSEGAAPPKTIPTKSTFKALPAVRDHTTNQLDPAGDEFIPREIDENGEKKVMANGQPLGNRVYRCKTFLVPHRGDKLFMLATECAWVLGYRDSYLLFNKNRSLYKIIASQAEKDDLVQEGILSFSYRSRQIAIVTARSMFRQFGSRVIENGRRGYDDYWEAKAQKQGLTENDPPGEKRPGAAQLDDHLFSFMGGLGLENEAPRGSVPFTLGAIQEADENASSQPANGSAAQRSPNFSTQPSQVPISSFYAELDVVDKEALREATHRKRLLPSVAGSSSGSSVAGGGGSSSSSWYIAATGSASSASSARRGVPGNHGGGPGSTWSDGEDKTRASCTTVTIQQSSSGNDEQPPPAPEEDEGPQWPASFAVEANTPADIADPDYWRQAGVEPTTKGLRASSASAMAAMAATTIAPDLVRNRPRDYSGIVRRGPRLEITGPAYQDHTRSSPVADLQALTSLLQNDLRSIANGDYAWLMELEKLGYTRSEMAAVLLEEASDTPWIFFEPAPRYDPMLVVNCQQHLPGCVHQIPWSPQHADENWQISANGPSNRQSDAISQIQTLCGLAGISPSKREPEDWNGTVVFEDNTVASVTYAHEDVLRVLSRVKNILELFFNALHCAQSAGLCCQSFTILRQEILSSKTTQDSVINLSRVEFSKAEAVLDEVGSIAKREIKTVAGVPATLAFLTDIFPGETLFDSENKGLDSLHLCCLSAQILTVGFLSYIQAHAGPLHPYFLDTPTTKIKLFGLKSLSNQPVIEVALRQLTCLGDMLQSSVLVFGPAELLTKRGKQAVTASEMKYDVLANAEDVIDTWGPAQFIVTSNSNSDKKHNDSSSNNGMKPSAISICGGVIFMAEQVSNRFHWSKQVSPEEFCHGFLDPAVKIRIGSPVTVNKNCKLDTKRCRAHATSRGFLSPLGTFAPAWALAEKQVGIQAGQYAVVQANAAYHRFPGRTLKQYRLEQGDEELVPFLDDCWAVQVSLCTGVARRVPLREMVADLLPIFANNLTFRDDYNNWVCLTKDKGIIEAFRGKNLRSWLRTLSRPHHDLVLQMVRRILHTLSETGLDREGKSLLVSWPYEDDTRQCFSVDLRHRESSWARLIADCEDSAIFMYASRHCLETAEFRCRGIETCPWRNVVPLLETAVIISSAITTVAAAPMKLVPGDQLIHNETYHFRKRGDVYFVRAEQPDSNAVVRLVRKPSSIPNRFKQRLFSRAQLLRERNTSAEAGNVAWFTAGL